MLREHLRTDGASDAALRLECHKIIGIDECRVAFSGLSVFIFFIFIFYFHLFTNSGTNIYQQTTMNPSRLDNASWH